MTARRNQEDDPAVSPAAASWRRSVLLAAAIILLTALAYIPAMKAGFIWDDDLLLTQNPLIKASDGLYRFWFTQETPDYWPLWYSSWWLEWRLWGADPAPYHVTNVLLHALSAVLVWRVLRRLRMPGALLAGFIFAVHPVAVASVAWISERKNTLSMVFYLLTVLAYLRFEDGGKRRWYGAAVLLFVLALLSKTSVVMLPFVLLLLTWWRRGSIKRQDVVRSLPFFAASLVMGLMTVWYQYAHAGGDVAMRPEGMLSRVAATGWIVWFYIYKALVPVRLAMFYPRWDVDGANVISFLPLAALAGCFVVLWMHRKTWGKAPLLALAYFVVTAAPVLGLLKMSFMQYSLVADHLQYLPVIGVIALLAAAACCVTAKRTWRYPVAAVLLAVLAVLTWRQAGHYKNHEALWTHTIAVNDRAWAAYADRGAVYASQNRFEDALRDYGRAIELKPDYPHARYNRGNAYAALRRFDDAVRDYTRAIELKPDYTEACAARGNAYAALGRFDHAVRDYTRVIRLQPGRADAYTNRGNAHCLLGQFDRAIRDYDRAIRVNRTYAPTYSNRAQAHLGRGAYDKAWADVDACRRLGGTVPPQLLEELKKASGRDE